MKNWTVLIHVEMPDERLKEISESITKNFNNIDDFVAENMDELLAELKKHIMESDESVIGVTFYYVKKPAD